jgi:hypothetical protein
VLTGVNTRPRYEPAPPADPGAEPANANAVANAAAAAVANAAAVAASTGIGAVGTEAADAEIIGSSQDDPELFAVIFDRHADEIHRYAARRLGQQAAPDVVSDVFLAALPATGTGQAALTGRLSEAWHPALLRSRG